MHRPRSTPQIATNRSKSQAKVIEICMDEEDSTQSTMIYPSKNENTKTVISDTKPEPKLQNNMLLSDSLQNLLPIHSYPNKENISDEIKVSYKNQSRVPLGQKLVDNTANLNIQTEHKPLIISEEQHKSLVRKKLCHETSCTSDLLNNLDMNIQEFKELLANNMQKAKTNDKTHSRLPIQPPYEDSRILEISQLSLKLEESKFCTENEPSELKILKDFESKNSQPTNNSHFERYFQSEVKGPDVTKEYEFIDTWRITDPKVSSPYINQSGDLANLSIGDSFRDGKSQQEESANYSVQEIVDRRNQLSEQRFAPARDSEKGALDAFQEDYVNIFESFKKIMPEFESKSHILRYLTGNEALGFEFLYSVMLDLKEIEKHVFLMHHKNSSREEFLKEQLFEITNSNQKYQKEIAELHSKIEEKTVKSSRDSSRPRMTTMHVRGRYQALLQALNELYGDKMNILKQSFTNAKSYNQTRISINSISEDLVEEIENEEMQDIVQENLIKIKELHDLIGVMHKERNTMPRTCKMEDKGTSADFGSTGLSTGRRLETFENERSDYFEGREEEQETQLNISEIEMSRFEALLREKDGEIELIRKKEQMYQNVIYSLTKELRQLRGDKKREVWQDKDIDMLFKTDK